ncbi:MAG: VacJ family lipoprotein [Gammaproteobacteria bacterium]
MQKKNILVLLVFLMYPLHGLCSDVPAADAGTPTDATVTGDDIPLFDETEIVEVFDPLEPFNRVIFWFNDKVYFIALKPLARGWRYAPERLRISIKNFFENLQAPIRFVNAGLQGKFTAAGTELTRFVTNSTLGIGGLFDPSKEHFGQLPQDEDTGQTLGFYGVGPGPYLVLPFVGPSNLRDTVGKFADTRMDLAWYLWGEDNKDYIGARVVDTITWISLDKDTYEGVKRDALDPYLFMRSAHDQYRRNQINR